MQISHGSEQIIWHRQLYLGRGIVSCEDRPLCSAGRDKYRAKKALIQRTTRCDRSIVRVSRTHKAERGHL